MADYPSLPPDAFINQYYQEPALPSNILNAINFLSPEGKTVITIDLDKKTVTLAPGWSNDQAAKLFWNRVAQVAGKPDVFPNEP